MRVLVLIGLVLVACGSHVESPALAPATATPTHTQAATVTPSLSPTVRPNPTAGPGTYTSLPLAYRIDLPQGWRRSACQSSRDADSVRSETFTAATVDEESYGGIGGSGQEAVAVWAADPAGLAPVEWLRAGKIGFTSSDQQIDQATFDGRNAGRLTLRSGPNDLIYAVLIRDRMLVVARTRRTPGAAAEQVSRSVMESVHFLSDSELVTARASLATPSPQAARSMQDVADTLTRGFAAKDMTVLASVVAPCVMRGGEPGDADWGSTTMRLAELQQRFAAGLVVTFQGAPQIIGGPAIIRTTWTQPGQPTRIVKLWLQQFGATWYWEGWITCAFASC